jgi:hypothetical protein
MRISEYDLERIKPYAEKLSTLLESLNQIIKEIEDAPKPNKKNLEWVILSIIERNKLPLSFNDIVDKVILSGYESKRPSWDVERCLSKLQSSYKIDFITILHKDEGEVCGYKLR